MANFFSKINLLKLKRSAVINIQGRGEVLQCLVIPIKENNLYISKDENTVKGVYLNLNVYEIQNPKYEETHLLKQSLSKEIRDAMSEEELKAMPILGSMKPRENKHISVNAPFAQPVNIDELPF